MSLIGGICSLTPLDVFQQPEPRLHRVKETFGCRRGAVTWRPFMAASGSPALNTISINGERAGDLSRRIVPDDDSYCSRYLSASREDVGQLPELPPLLVGLSPARAIGSLQRKRHAPLPTVADLSKPREAGCSCPVLTLARFDFASGSAFSGRCTFLKGSRGPRTLVVGARESSRQCTRRSS